MSLKILVEDYLDEQPLFRERKNKDRGIVNLLINRYGLQHAIQAGYITKDRLVAMVQDFASMDRAWRKSLEDNPRWRGSDYDEKDQLEANAMKNLGYNVKNVGPAEAVAEQSHQPTLLHSYDTLNY
jgi:hypothetical protein